MGVWSTGLYSGDYALDLRSTIGAVSRLPFDGEKLLEILRTHSEGAADNPADENHAAFWFVVADQLHRRGIPCPEARDRALRLIADGSDLSMNRDLGMDAPNLRKRAAVLDQLATRLRTTVTEPRPTLKKPQAFILELGGVYAFPVSRERSINPYFASVEEENALRVAARRNHSKHPSPPEALRRYFNYDANDRWVQDGWCAMAVVDRGRAFGYLSWYTPLVLNAAVAEKPTDLTALRGFGLVRPGTLSAAHFKRMRFEQIGRFDLDLAAVARLFNLRDGAPAAIAGTTISDDLQTTPLAGEPVIYRGITRSIAARPYVQQLNELSVKPG